MTEEYHLPPSAADMLQSMRSSGYELETALADIVDNSISADATEIDIFHRPTDDGYVFAVIDNGHGMSKERLTEALRHATNQSGQQRKDSELGRFGLGLKTASLSQCRRLTVLSTDGDTVSGAEWDLDTVQKRQDWIILRLDEQEIANTPFREELQTPGTLVLWRKIDTLPTGRVEQKDKDLVNRKMAQVLEHLSLVFHRFLSGDTPSRKKLVIRVNGHPLEPTDPFAQTHTATQKLPEEVVKIEGHNVRLQSYILPHYSKLDAVEQRRYSQSDFLADQGVYIYRNYRLMTWGGWLRLIPKSEKMKLARVCIEFPSAVDSRWDIDIMKSRATAPAAVRERLVQIIQEIQKRSTGVHRGRAQRLLAGTSYPVLWQRAVLQGGKIVYSVDTAHPLIAAITDKLGEEQAESLHLALSTLASSLPIEAIYSDYAAEPKKINVLEDQDLDRRISDIYRTLTESGISEPAEIRGVIVGLGWAAGREAWLDKYLEEMAK